MKVYRIVLTGGPCAGKTTILNNVKEELKRNGIQCLIVPEAATELINKGIDPTIWDTYEFQEYVLERQLFYEEENYKYIDKFNGVVDRLVIIYDRGIYDNMAYFNNTMDFKRLLKEKELNTMITLDQYDLVLDLLSVATCKPEFYTLDNNKARMENVEIAKFLDKKTSNVWANHRNIRIISSNCSVEEETNVVLNYIYDLINGKNTIETFRFVVNEEKSNLDMFRGIEPITINNTYIDLCNGKLISRLSERISDDRDFVLDGYAYIDEHKKRIDSICITSDIYKKLYNECKHLGYETLKQFNFIDNEILYRLCYYRDMLVLEVQKNDFNDIKIPNNINVISEIDDFGLKNGFAKKLHL